MKKWIVGILFFLLTISNSNALTPYSEESFEQATKNNEKFIVYLHANWCPNCVRMKKTLETMENNGELKDIKIFVADWDKETAVKSKYKIDTWAILLAFKGSNIFNRATNVKQEEMKQFLTNYSNFK